MLFKCEFILSVNKQSQRAYNNIHREDLCVHLNRRMNEDFDFTLMPASARPFVNRTNWCQTFRASDCCRVYQACVNVHMYISGCICGWVCKYARYGLLSWETESIERIPFNQTLLPAAMGFNIETKRYSDSLWLNIPHLLQAL